jgi:hypothetical protein
VQKPIVTLGWRLNLDDHLHWGYIRRCEGDEMREVSRSTLDDAGIDLHWGRV